MPNPSGVNSFDRFKQEAPYGQISQQGRMQQAYPIPGVPDVAKKDQRRAVKGGQQGPPPPAASPAPAEQVNPQFVMSQAWQQIAAIPGASDLVKAYAMKAAQQSG